jgi:hypothetical protein
MNRATFLTRTRQMSDTVGNTLDYPDELLKDLGSLVFMDEWKKILGANAYYATQRVFVSPDADLRFTVAELTTGSAESIKTHHRVLRIARGDGGELTFAPADSANLMTTTNNGCNEPMWTRVGSEIQCWGVSSSDTLTVLGNYIPCLIADLNSDTSPIDFPAGYTPVLFYETAALALLRGGREDQEAASLQRMADVIRQRMLADLSREAAQPLTFTPADDGLWEWGN